MHWVSQTFHSSLPCILLTFILSFAPGAHSPFSNSALSTFTLCVSACVYMCACMHVRVHVCMHIHICMHMYLCVIYVCVCEYLYVCVCESLSPSSPLCVCVCVHVYVWLCMCDAGLTYERERGICLSGFTSCHIMISSSAHFPSGDISLFFVAE